MSPARLGTLAFALSLGCGSYFDPTPTARRDVDAGPALNGCDESRYVDQRDPAAARVVSFGGAVGMAFSPPCVVVSAGQAVRFEGPFASHPLAPGALRGETDAGSVNPIAPTRAGDSATFMFPRAGDFPYFCENHGAMGMTGVIRVR